MSDTTVTIIAIFLAAILMFIVPMMATANTTDDVTQLAVQTATTEFVDNIRTTGVLTLDNYSKFVERITSTGNTYDVEVELQILDENLSKKATQSNYTKIGENVYYSVYTTQVLDQLRDSSKNNKYTLKEGDIVSVTATNTNTTISQQLKNAFYKVTGSDTNVISAKHAGMVTVNGN
jgi:hypothetical protein